MRPNSPGATSSPPDTPTRRSLPPTSSSSCQHSLDLAQSTWPQPSESVCDYQSRNLLFNGGFKADPLPGPVDWRLRSEPRLFETTRGSGALRIQFHGKSNVNYDHLSQTAILPRPRRYRLSVRIKTDNLTINEGLRLAI
jgi:hypothetical protein